MGENYLDMATVIVIFFALGILLSRLGGIGGIVVRIKRIVCKLMGHSGINIRIYGGFLISLGFLFFF